MDISDLSSKEKGALANVLEYWVTHWDWECATLFGLEKNEVEAVLNTWPACVTEQESITALALVGALREFLYGASAVAQEKVKQVTGLSFGETAALFERLMPRIDRALD